MTLAPKYSWLKPRALVENASTFSGEILSKQVISVNQESPRL